MSAVDAPCVFMAILLPAGKVGNLKQPSMFEHAVAWDHESVVKTCYKGITPTDV